jgi:hypothetical protein
VDSFRPRQFSEFSRGEYGQHGTEPFLLKAREAARRLAISERYLYQLTLSGEVPSVLSPRRTFPARAIKKLARGLLRHRPLTLNQSSLQIRQSTRRVLSRQSQDQ